MKKGAWILLASGILLSANLAHAGDTRHVNFAAFEKVDKGFKFEPAVMGKFSDFIAAMDGAQILLLSHTSDAVNGDIINIQQDVLRESGQALGDFGINCSLSFKAESSKDNVTYSLGGLCKILRVGDGQDQKHSAVIAPTNLPDAAQGVDVWIELYEDKATGIAFYANVGH